MAGDWSILVASAVVLAVAVSAIYRTVAAWTERDLSLNAAGCTGCIMHFALLVAAATTVESATVLLFASSAAVRATAWLVGETFLSEEILLRSSENELCATIAAGKIFVLEHYIASSNLLPK